ncbi:hypothetical protein D9M70_444470 [compost metagenome]
MAGKTPEVRTVVDVEDDPGAAFLGKAHGLALGRIGVRLGKMRAGNQDGAGRADKVFRNVVFAERVVGAVVAIEEQREGLVVFDREDGERRQPLRIGDDAARLDAFTDELLTNEAAHLFVADAGQQRRLETQAGRADRDVAGAATDRLGETRNVFKPRADLLAVEIDRGSADGDQVERLCSLCRNVLAHCFLPADTLAGPTIFVLWVMAV